MNKDKINIHHSPAATILAVDDTSESLALLVKILTREGYEVRPADSGELALASVNADPPDLILLDVRMKGMDGLEVCRRLKAREETQHIPIILISAFSDVKDWVEGLRLGAADYITKPFQTEELLTRVKTHLTLRQATVSLEQQADALRQINEQLQSGTTERKQAEEEFKTIFNLSQDMVGVFTAEGKLLKVNPSWEKVLGYTQKELLDQGWSKLIHPDDVEKTYKEVERQIKGGSLVNFINRYKCKDGTYKTLEWYVTFAEEGIAHATARDITERKRVEEELKESEERQKTELENVEMILKTTQDGFWLVDASTGHLINVNEAASSMLGYTRKEFLKRGLIDIDAKWSPEEISREMQNIRATGHALFETRQRTKSGQIIDVEVSVNYLPVNDQFFSFIRNITKRKQAEEELTESEGKFRAIFNNASDGMFLVDLEAKKFFICNTMCVKKLGYTQEEFSNLDITDIHPGEDLPFIFEQIGKFSRGEEGIRSDLRFKRKDGSIFTADISAALLTIVKKRYLLIIFKDITERKQAEEKLKSLVKEKEVLIKEVHHRVKNNFAVVSSLLGLQSRAIHDTKIKAMFMQSRDRINSMALLHKRLYQSQDLTHINFSEYLSTLAADLFKMYKIDTNRISTVIEVEDIVLDADKVIPCGLIVNELVSNALKYGFPKSWTDEGQIKVSFHKINGSDVELAVMDNGIGLPDDFNIKKSPSLGLQLVTMMAEDQLGGELKVSSNGSTKFQIQFALQEPEVGAV